MLEREPAETGQIVDVATVFLTNRECPWRCVMCDLWKNTLVESVPAGAIPAQIQYALERMPAARHIKLYNSGSFFDPNAIPISDYERIAALSSPFERVIVESHPSLIGSRCRAFGELLRGDLEVAMGLETAHPGVLEKLNKGLTLEQFARAAEILRTNRMALRVFVLVKPPFLDETEALEWANRSIDLAFRCGASAISLIPTRLGNGAMEELAARGLFSQPKLRTLESAVAYGLRQARGRVFADLWDLEKFSECKECFDARKERLREMNYRQALLPPVQCGACEGGL